jgi:hypothetical protein
MKNVTIKSDGEMRDSSEYWQAFEQWKKLDIRLDASKRATREEAHERPTGHISLMETSAQWSGRMAE